MTPALAMLLALLYTNIASMSHNTLAVIYLNHFLTNIMKNRMTKIMCGTKLESVVAVVLIYWLCLGISAKNKMKNTGSTAASTLYSSGCWVLLLAIHTTIHRMMLTMMMKEP